MFLPEIFKALFTSNSLNVPEYNEKNFYGKIFVDEPVLVMFYLPACSHCQIAKPKFLKAAEELKKEGLAGRLVLVNAQENPSFIIKYDINGFLSFKLFKTGKYLKDFEEAPTTENIVTFMKKHTNNRN